MHEVLTCQDLLEELGEYLEGDLAAEVRAALEVHLAHCSVCTVVVDSMRKTLKIVTDRETFEVPAEVSSRILARVREEKGKP